MIKPKTVAAALSVLALSACVIAPYPREAGYYPEAGAPMIVTEVAPPPPYVEVVPAIPFPGAIWIGGYWGWSGGRHTWVGGHWEHGRPGYVWNPHRWENRSGRWYLHEGGWGRR
jgi:hypothetical protein